MVPALPAAHPANAVGEVIAAHLQVLCHDLLAALGRNADAPAKLPVSNAQ
jgi:hypothetical protein